MSWLVLQVAFAGGIRVDLPLPIRPAGEATTCVFAGQADTKLAPVTIEDGMYRITCESRDEAYRVCVLVLTDHVPRRVTPLRCEGEKQWLEVHPTPSYDRNDDVLDGVDARRGVRQAMFFHAPDLPDASGTLKNGACAVQQGVLVVRPIRPLRRERTCELNTPSGPLRIPIRPVPIEALLRP